MRRVGIGDQHGLTQPTWRDVSRHERYTFTARNELTTAPAGAGRTSTHCASSTVKWFYPCHRPSKTTQIWPSTIELGDYAYRFNPRPRASGRPAELAKRPITVFQSTPACERETGRPSRTYRLRRVYPRVRGGNLNLGTPRAAIQGLSPRARGKRIVRPCRCLCLGSIPACAGETQSPARPSHYHGVYPRVRGGNTYAVGGITAAEGLSPRARGKLGFWV